MTADPWSFAVPYESFMGRWSSRLAAEVLDWVQPPGDQRWVDVGCGTGAASEAVLAVAAPRSVVGIDPSEAYVAAAVARLVDQRAAFEVGDALALPFPADSVDQVISGLVLNFVPDPVRAVEEMLRVLAPGGHATAYVWDYADGMQMLRTFWDAAIAEDPAAREFDEGSRFPVCRLDGLRSLFSGVGFDRVQSQPIEIAMAFRDFDEFWTPFLGGAGVAPAYLASLPEGARLALAERLAGALLPSPDGQIRLTARAWAVHARA